MKIIKSLLTSILLMLSLSTLAQNYSSNTYYSQKGNYTNTYIGSFQKMVCCDSWGRSYTITCYNYKETLWVQKYGYKQVRMWGNNGWYWEWRQDYYWYYTWNYYHKC